MRRRDALKLMIAGAGLTSCQSTPGRVEPTALPDPATIVPQKLLGDIVAAEGPAVDRSGNVYFVNYLRRGTIGRLKRDGSAEVLVDLTQFLPAEGKKQPAANGIKIDDRGNLVVAESGTGHVLRITPDGKQVDVLVSVVDGERLQSVNDIVLDRSGSIYFSSPPAMKAFRLKPWTGSVLVMNPEPVFANGMAMTSDGRYFIVGDSAGRRVMLMEVFEGTGRNLRTLVDFLPPGYPRDLSKAQQTELTAKKVAIPDGMAFDAFGRLYVTTWDGGTIEVVDVPSGQRLASYPMPVGKISNLHFGRGDLYVTADGSLWKLPLGIRGQRYSAGCGY